MLAAPDYEVKMLVDPGEALTKDGKPTDQLIKAFALGEPKDAEMQFMDSKDRSLNAKGWIARVRAIQGKERMELTYKKRYEVDGDDIEAAIVRAANDGFAAVDEAEEDDGKIEKKPYELQVEWGLHQKTLTVSWKPKGGRLDGGSIELPDEEEARKRVLKKLPSMMQGVRPALEEARRYGPVPGVRWTGEWLGDELTVEMWWLSGKRGGDDPIVEVSLKKKRRESARLRHKALRQLLVGRDWLAGQQRSKTAIVIERDWP